MQRDRELGTDVLRGYSLFLRPTVGKGVELWSMVQPIKAARPATQALQEARHLICC